jgi:hypothetical protein
MQLDIKKDIERENAITQNAKQRRKKKQSQEPIKNAKHKLCHLTKRP